MTRFNIFLLFATFFDLELTLMKGCDIYALFNVLSPSPIFLEPDATARVCAEVRKMMIYDDDNDNGLQEPSPGAGVRHHRDAPHEAHSAADDVWQTHREETHLLLPRRGKLSQLSYKLSLSWRGTHYTPLH